MGQYEEFTCLDCDENFMLALGGGMVCGTLICNRCGQTRNFRWREREMRGRGSIRPSDEPDYKDAPHPCECGGKFAQGAKPRCLKCRSTRLRKEANPLIMWD
jgi:hypothetical protein